MKLKRALIFMLSIVFISNCFFGCGKNSSGSNSINKESNKNKTIAVVAKGESLTFWQSVKRGAEDAGKKYGYNITFRGPVSENASELPSQKEMLSTALSNNVSGIVLATIGEGFTDMLHRAYDQKIPVVEFDSGIWQKDKDALERMNKNPIISSVATSNEKASGIVAENFYEAIKDDIEKQEGVYLIGVIQHDRTLTGEDRVKGFIEKFTELADENEATKGKYKIEKEIKDGDQNNAYVDALNALVEKNAKAVFMSNEGVVKQVSDAISANNGKYDNIKFCGFDAGTKQIDWIKRDSVPYLIGSVAQDSYNIGYNAVEQCVFAIEGEMISKNVEIGGQWYDKNNIDEMISNKIVYEG